MSDDTKLRAGAAQVDITPEAGTHLAGAVGYHRPARLALDPLHAKALVLETGESRLCILALDVTIITEEWTAFIRDRAQSVFGLEPDGVMVHATQTHSAPPIGHFMLDPDFPELPEGFEWVRGGDVDYSEWAANRAVDAIGQAVESVEPVEMAAASGSDGRWAANRRAVTTDGGITMVTGTWAEPTGQQSIRYIEGPIDPEVGVLVLRSPSIDIPAILLHHTCHPVCVFPRPLVSADWPGAWGAQVQRTLGEECVPIVLNGACGNSNPADRSDHRPMARGLAETARMIFERLEFAPEAALDFRRQDVPIPLRELTDDELSWCQEVLDEHPDPPWDDQRPNQIVREWIQAASTWSVHLQRRRDPNLQYEVQALRIGDAAVVGLPGEPFAELGLAIKMASPFSPTFLAHCTCHYTGYIPTPEALERGGHEATTRYWAKLVPEAFEMIRETAVELLEDMARG